MKPLVQETEVRSVLSRSGIPGMEYCVNPFTGCFHGCRYCYADFMKRFSGHREPWGGFVDVKMNAPSLLRRELKRAKRAPVMISSVTDPYQPAESGYRITRACLSVLLEYGFPVRLLTKSHLVLRDIDLLKQFNDLEVGITITTDKDRIRKIFEPNAPPPGVRIRALKQLSDEGINTFVFIGPVLPMDPLALAAKIGPYAGRIIIDRMNYPRKTIHLYRKHSLEQWLDRDFLCRTVGELANTLGGSCVDIINR